MATKRRRGPVDQPGLDVLDPLQDIIRQVREGSLTAEQMWAFAEHRNPFDVSEASASDAPTQLAGKISDLHKVTIDRTLSWQDRVVAMRLGLMDDDFTEGRFPLPIGEPIERELALLGMVEAFMLRDAPKEAKKLGFELAETEDGVAYVTAFPRSQIKNPIIVGGSRACDSRGLEVMPVFDYFNCERNLALVDDLHGLWYAYYLVLVRRKSAATCVVAPKLA